MESPEQAVVDDQRLCVSLRGDPCGFRRGRHRERDARDFLAAFDLQPGGKAVISNDYNDVGVWRSDGDNGYCTRWNKQRADEKYHCGNLWTNTCCSHPRPGEDLHKAALRRLQEEMGFVTNLDKAFHFTYRADFDNGLTEHEFDHVFTGTYNGPVMPDDREVKDYRFVQLDELKQHMKNHPAQYTPWFKIAFPQLEQYLASSSYTGI